jgi:hypothetical protein
MNRVRIGTLARWTAWSFSAAFVALLLLTFAACGGGGVTQQQQGSSYPFLLQAPGTLRPLVTVGSSLSYAISASPGSAGSPPGVIAVTMSGIPSGLTVAPDSFSMDTANNVWSMPVTITASSSLQPGTYPITVTGTNPSGSYSITITVGIVEQTQPPASLHANVMYSFGGSPDASSAAGPLISDNVGNLYGVTPDGGTYELGGTVFELSFSNGTWQKTVLYSFDDGQPMGVLVFDGTGNLYGVTGETGNLCNPNGCSGSSLGTVYELTDTGSGWQRTVLHTFSGSPDGEQPGAGLVMDKAGNLYGTTMYGGDYNAACGGGCGTVFTLQRSGSAWAYSVIHKFGYSDGSSPQSQLIFDPQGNLYGTAFLGGDTNCPWFLRFSVGVLSGPACGTVFQMTLSGGVWQESTIHTFRTSAEGAGPTGLVLDSAGNLYGFTTFGGFDTSQCAQCGNFFKLTPSGSGWTLTQLYDFLGDDDGMQPFNNLVSDQAGNVYGVTPNGGPPNCGDSSIGYYGCGSVVRLSQIGGLGQTGQGWVATAYYDFPGGAVGSLPSSLTLVGGHLYVTTQGGSPAGLIFEMSP